MNRLNEALRVCDEALERAEKAIKSAEEKARKYGSITQHEYDQVKALTNTAEAARNHYAAVLEEEMANLPPWTQRLSRTVGKIFTR